MKFARALERLRVTELNTEKSIEEVLKNVDHLLHKAKADCRNRVYQNTLTEISDKDLMLSC
ncbi:hypothetical protein MASR2M48_18840 [Spirochaetota bacterium]|jgi:hypothetical protein